MSLRDLVVKQVATARKLTKPFAVDPKNGKGQVSYQKFLHASGSGTRSYAAAIMIEGIVDWEQRQLRLTDGTLSVSRASIMILDPKIVVDDQDIFILPDGTTGPILDMKGPTDPGTTHPFATTVYIG